MATAVQIVSDIWAKCKFKERKAEWLAVFAIVLTLVLALPGLIWGADGRALAIWEAEKDYHE